MTSNVKVAGAAESELLLSPRRGADAAPGERSPGLPPLPESRSKDFQLTDELG